MSGYIQIQPACYKAVLFHDSGMTLKASLAIEPGSMAKGIYHVVLGALSFTQ